MSSKKSSGFIPLSTVPQFPFEAIWKDEYSQKPVIIVGAARKYKGKQYFKIKGSEKIAPIDQLFTEEHDQVTDIQDRSKIESIRMSDVAPEKVRWLWEGRIPIGMVSLLEGMEGIGKSTLLCAIAAAITCGKGLPDMNLSEPANVLWLSAEDSLSYALKPRLLAAGADCDRVYAIGETFSFNQGGVLLVSEQIAKVQPILVVIDPIFAYLAGDANKGQDVRGITNRFKDIAEQFGCGILMVRHINKTKGHGDDRAAGSGSIEWRAAVRSVLLAGFDPDDRLKRAVTQTKNNFGPNTEPIGYKIETDHQSPSGARFSWTGVSDLTAQRILSSPELDDDYKVEKKNARDQAKDFLKEILEKGKVPVESIEAEAGKARIARNTLYRAKASLGIKAIHTGNGSKTVWYWEFPSQNGQISQIGLDFNLVEQDPDMTNSDLVGHVRNPQNLKLLNPDFPPDMTNGHVSLGDDPRVRYPLGHVRPEIVPIHQETESVPDMTNSNQVGHVRNSFHEIKKSKINKTHCRECGAKLEPDGTCDLCSKGVAL